MHDERTTYVGTHDERTRLMRRTRRMLAVLVAVGGLLTLSLGSALAHYAPANGRHTGGAAPDWSAKLALLAAAETDEDDADESETDEDAQDADESETDEDAQDADESDDVADEDEQGEDEQADSDDDEDEADEDEADDDSDDDSDDDEADDQDSDDSGDSEHDD